MKSSLPRGIWHDVEKNRYRVRLYRNGKAYLRYRKTLSEALDAYDELKKKLANIPVMSREEARRGVVPKATFSSMAKALRS
jgi:hypothetical protein